MRLDELTLQTEYLQQDKELYDITKPLPLENPYLISFNPQAAALIDLDISSHKDPNFVELLNGTFIPKGTQYFSMCYAGHQFGHYLPRLGDGRAHNLGSIHGWHLQTKGSGETLYSRMADGRATIRSSIREYLMSEAMHHLGIPTTRALGVIGSETKILRDQLHDAAIVMRMSPSWIRFGTFEYFYYYKEYEKLQTLADVVIQESYPHLEQEEDKYYQLFSGIVEKTALLIAQWQAIGFCHGVMNTDNMSIAGITLDYGPFSMLDDFDFGFVCNQTDKAGRYSYGQQPNISYWNLTMLAKTFVPMVEEHRLEEKLKAYGSDLYPDAYVAVMRKKLGLFETLTQDTELITELVGALQDATVDYTQFFRTLSRYNGERMPLYEIAMNPEAIEIWLTLYDQRLALERLPESQRHESMLKTNPKYVLKNYMLREATELAEKGDFSKVEALMCIACHPFDELPEYEHYAKETPWEHKNQCLSCAS